MCFIDIHSNSSSSIIDLCTVYVVIFFNFLTTSNHLHPLQVENCGSNSRLVVGEDDYGKFRIERANGAYMARICMQAIEHHFMGT